MENVLSAGLKVESNKWFISEAFDGTEFFGYYREGVIGWKFSYRSHLEWTHLPEDMDSFEERYKVFYVSEKYLLIRGWI